MRILMLAQFYPPIMGGEEQHVRALSHALARRGHQVVVATLGHKGSPEFELDGNVRVYRIHSTMQRAGFIFSDRGRTHAPPFPDPEAMLELRRIVAQEQPEIVHAHNWLVHSFLPLKAWSRAKLIVTLHDYSFICAQKRLMYYDERPCSGPGLTKCFSCAIHHYGPAKGVTTGAGNGAMRLMEKRQVDLFLAVSRATAVGNGLVGSSLPYRVVPNFILEGLDPAAGDVTAYLEQLPKQDFMLFVGDVVPDKGIKILLKAYAGIQNAPPLVLIGRRTERSLSPLPANVTLLGSFPHAAVLQAWRRSLIGLLPSIVPETFGLVALEAMAAGRPVIASRIGGLRDLVVDGESGFLTPPEDVAALRQAIARLLGDAGLRERMGRAAARRAAEFSADRIVPRIEQIYRRLLSGGGPEEAETVPWNVS